MLDTGKIGGEPKKEKVKVEPKRKPKKEKESDE